MNWYSVGIAAVSGGIAGGVAALIVWGIRKSKPFFWIVFVSLFLVVNSILRQLILPVSETPSTSAQIESSLESITIYQTLRKHDPSGYVALVLSLTDAFDKGLNGEQLGEVAWGKLAKHTLRMIPKSSDNAVLTFVSVLIYQLEESQDIGGDLCFNMLYSESIPLSELIAGKSAELQKRELAAADLIIRSFDQNRRIPAEHDVMPFLDSVYVDLIEEYGDDIYALEDPSGSSVSNDRICSMTISLYSRIMLLPKEQSAPLLRWMFQE